MIYVFKTAVRTKRQVRSLAPGINKILPQQNWNFDLSDCDCILRIDSEEHIVKQIMGLLNRHNLYFEELK